MSSEGIIIVDAKPGEHISDAMLRVAQVAVRHGLDVTLIHNDRKYHAACSSIREATIGAFSLPPEDEGDAS